MSDEMEIRLITGHRVRMLPDELVKMAVHRSSIAALGIVVSVLLVINLHPLVAGAPFWARVAVYFPAIMVWIVLSVLLTLAQAELAGLLGYRRRAHLSLSIMVAAIGCTLVGQFLAKYIGLPEPDLSAWMVSEILLNYLISEGVMIFIFLTVFPVTIDDIRFGNPDDLLIYPPSSGRPAGGDISSPSDASNMPKKPGKPHNNLRHIQVNPISINSVKISPLDMIRISSQGGYVEIVTKDRRYLELFPTQELISMIPANFGCQVHRSHWVSFKAIKAIRKEGRNRIVVLSDGSEIQVARHRQQEFERNLSLYADPQVFLNADQNGDKPKV